MNWVINLIMKWAGLGKLWDALSGKKAYIGAAAGGLAGLAQVLQKIVSLNSPAEAVEYFKHIGGTPEAALIGLAWATLALKHSDQKLEAKIDAK